MLDCEPLLDEIRGMLERPTFLLSSERTGSNLIRLIVGAHPSFYAPPPVHLGRELWSQLHLYGDLRRDPAWRLLLRHVRLVLEQALLPLEATPSDEELAALPRRSFADVYALVYACALKRSGRERLFIKENHAYRFVLHLLAAFPDARFVLQLRDPRDFLVSCKNAGLRYGSVTSAIEVWEADTHGALSVMAALGPERVFVQRYEDLIREPGRVLPALCRFLGVPHTPAMLDFHLSEAAKLASTKKDYWRNLARPLIADNAGKHREQLTSAELALVEARLGDLMLLAGYEPSAPRAVSPLAYRAKSLEQLWRQALRRIAPGRAGLPPAKAERVRFRKQRLPGERRELGPRIALSY